MWKQCLHALLIIAGAALLSIYVLLPKTGDPLLAMCVGLLVLIGPAAWIRGAGESAPSRRLSR